VAPEFFWCRVRVLGYTTGPGPLVSLPADGDAIMPDNESTNPYSASNDTAQPVVPPPEGKYHTAPIPTTGMPGGIPYIIGNEAAERFSYYGMSGILFVFLTQHLINVSGEPNTMSPEQAREWVHYFIAAVYAFPILGAILSDWLLGKYYTIISISLLYCVGHALLAIMDFPAVTGIDPKWMLGAGLICLSLGAGGIKPCVSAHVGDQFGKLNEHLITRVFGWFYFSINLGSVVSMALCPWLLDKYGPGWAFGVPGILMAIATLAFWMGRHKFIHIPAAGNQFFRETFSPIGIRAIFNLIPLYVLIFPFFMLFDQTHSAWVEQAESMNGDFGFFTALPSQLQAVNPAFILLFIPLFSYVIYPAIDVVFKLTPLRKIGIGMFMTAVSFAIIAVAQQRIDAGETPHMMWQIVAYAVLTAAEVMVSITSLEFSYTQAPRKMKSFIMGLYLLVAIALGNIVTARVNGYLDVQKKAGSPLLEGANYYWFFTGLMLASAVVFVVWSQFYRGSTFIQGAEHDAEALAVAEP
jgi:POT family proton-dependent oligopeptide transporter